MMHLSPLGVKGQLLEAIGDSIGRHLLTLRAVTAITAIRTIRGHAGCMENADVVYIANLAEYGQVPRQSILSSALLKDSKVKVLLFASK